MTSRRRAIGTRFEDVRTRIKRLREEVRRHDHLYYVENAPEISDEEYDALYDELVRLEERHPELRTSDSPTQRVGAAPLEAFPTVEHAAPMLSLESSGEEVALTRFDQRVRRALGGRAAEYVLEPKLDGASVEVVYEAGVLVRAATRGDGRRGEAVTENVRTIHTVPLRLREEKRKPPRFLSVRGEVLMSTEKFERLNERLAREGERPFVNARNAAAGSLRQLDSRVTASRPLDVLFYDVLAIDGERLRTQWEARQALSDWGLRLASPGRKAESVSDVHEFHADLMRRRDDLEHEIDGIVVKLNDLDARREIGTTARHPGWAFAYKFPARHEITRVSAIIPSIGRTGIITPIAILRPVQVGGVTVSRASLFNREEVRRKDVREGDSVRVQRAGDVIPQIVERIPASGKRGAPFQMPTTCPSCGSTLVDRGPRTVCPNILTCPAQQAARLAHFAARDALDIDGLGVETAQALVKKGLVKSLPDLFDLTREQLETLEGFAELSAGKLEAAIDRASETDLARFIYGVGIPDVGIKAARDLANHFGSMDALRKAGRERLVLSGVGPHIAEQVAAFFEDPRNAQMIDGLLDGRVTFRKPPASQTELDGLQFVFTGTLERFSRVEAEELVERHGGRATGSVSRATDYVVAGEDPGSKYERARGLGVRILDEAGFITLLESKGVTESRQNRAIGA